jgi:hypothetical protein
MSRANVKIQFSLASPIEGGSYALFYSNNGSGDIDYNAPLGGRLELMPDGAEDLPWYEFTGDIDFEKTITVSSCGTWLFAVKLFDKLGNASEAAEVEAFVHMAPDAPTGLKKNSYDSETKVLVLDVL